VQVAGGLCHAGEGGHMTDDTPWTVERVLRTPKAEILELVKRGEGPPVEVMKEVIERALAGRLARIRER